MAFLSNLAKEFSNFCTFRLKNGYLVALIVFAFCIYSGLKYNVESTAYGFNYYNRVALEKRLDILRLDRNKTLTEEGNTKVEVAAKSESVRLLCVVLTCEDYLYTRAKAVKETWGRRCDKTLFVSDKNNTAFPASSPAGIIPGYKNIWTKTTQAFLMLYRNYLNDFDWFLKSDDDAYIVVDNLKKFVSKFNASDPHYFGKRFKAYGGYNSGGGGYVISRESLSRLGKALNVETACNPDSNQWAEDLNMGRCLKSVGVRPGHTLDAEGRELFHSLSVVGEVNNQYPPWFARHSFYPVKKGYDCCSNDSISFHYISPGEMYTIDFLLYRMHV